MTDDFLSLLELQTRLRDGLQELFPGKYWVQAEIASVQARASGHCYIDLCQNGSDGVLAKAKAVIWRSRFAQLIRYFQSSTGSSLQVGMMILVRAQVSYSELYGLTLIIDEIEPAFTLGQAELERRRTIEALREDGLLDAQKQLELVPLPYRLAVISARDAAGFGDFCRHIETNPQGFRFDITLFEALMQGQDSPSSILEALDAVQSSEEPFDAVLIMRGGGSNLDLACFDDYSLCFGIANCPIPVFTAIGHERDHHVADMVAFDHVKTPTALADLFLDCYQAEDELLLSFAGRLRAAFLQKIASMEAKVESLGAAIAAADPRCVLSRGYTLVTDSRGKVLKKASEIEKGDEIFVYLSDGNLKAKVI